MDDAEFVFKQDSKEKKRVAASASKRVGKTKKCTFPYEMLTGKDRKKYMEASEVKVFQLRPMTVKEFRKQDGDKKIELLKWYGEKYGWNAAGIAAALETTFKTGQLILDEFMLTGMFKARMKEATKEQKRQFMDNRRELERQRLEGTALKGAQQPPKSEDTQTHTEQKKPTQKLTEENTELFELTLNGNKLGRTLRKNLEGIAASLDEGEVFMVKLSIVQLSYADERVCDVADA